jgi:murein DD-endopeptidase MepM/ murein hydrolase activator NlpD
LWLYRAIISETNVRNPRWGTAIETKKIDPSGTTITLRTATESKLLAFTGAAGVLFVLLTLPLQAFAFWPFDSLAPSFANAASSAALPGSGPALKAVPNIDPTGRGGGDITIVGGVALLPESGPEGTSADIQQKSGADTISLYVVRSGDTLGGIAKMFDVSVNTIKWANDIKSASGIHPGDELVILPVTGVKYTTKKGDTLASLAKKFGADANEIASFNGIDGAVAAGLDIIIPDGEIAAVPSTSGTGVTAKPHNVGPAGTPQQIGYYLKPILGGVKTQGIHGFNGVDFGVPAGTPILASAAGTVIIAREGGWNGGYGSYVVIQHSNGSQTLYAHASDVIVSQGQQIVQGQVIAYVGRTGKATGNHLHFEIRNGIRNPF